MKVLVNGGLNLSERDGWWAEAYTSEVGWALGDERAHGEDPSWDHAEAAQLYELLEREVTPEFYARDRSGIPRSWVARVRRSMGRLTPQFSATRSVREYCERYYLPAAAACRARSSNDGALAARIVEWLGALDRGWPSLAFGRLMIDTSEREHRFTVEVRLGVLEPQAVRVELFAEPQGDDEPFRKEMLRLEQSSTATGFDLYRASVPASRRSSDYTPRIVPAHPEVAVPLEAPHILWQR